MSTATMTGAHVSVNRKAFLAAINDVAGVVPTRSPKPILQSIKFVTGRPMATGDDGPVLIATDLEVSIARLVGGVTVVEEGQMILNPGRMKEIFSRANCEELSIFVEEGKIKVRGAKVKYDLPSEDPDLFPMPPNFDAAAYHVIAANDIRRLIGQTIYATDTESTKYALGGLMCELSADRIVMASTDGRRVAEANAAAETVGEPGTRTLEDGNAPVLAPKFVHLLTKTIRDDDPPVHMAIDALSSAIVRTERATIFGRLVDGRFPQYRVIFTQKQAGKIEVKSDILEAAVAQAAITLSEEVRGIDLTFSGDGVTLKAQACDVGNSDVEMEAAYDGPEIVVTCNAEYLMQPLRALGPDVRVKFSVDPREANIITTEDGLFRYAVMPMSRDR